VVGYVLVADKLASAVFTEVILFALAFFPVSGYVGGMAMGALDFYGYEHDFIVFLCVPVVSIPPSYFVDHHQNFLNLYPYPLDISVSLWHYLFCLSGFKIGPEGR
jgi:hypothetical protein